MHHAQVHFVPSRNRYELALLSDCRTALDLTTRYWDVASVPRRSFFELLAKFSRDDTEREKLEEFASAEGQQVSRLKMCVGLNREA